MNSVVQVYTTRFCGYCIRAKMLLSKREIPFEEINVGGDHEKRAWLLNVTGRRTVPQIFIRSVPIGGFEELAELDRDGELKAMIEGDV